LNALNQQELEEHLTAWSEGAVAIMNALAQAQDEARNPKQAATAAANLERAKIRAAELEKASREVVAVVQGYAAEPMAREVVYLLALSKHEQAERAQARLEAPGSKGKTSVPADAQSTRQAWQSAAEWWSNYLNDYETTSAAPAARRYLARCLQAQGQNEAARALLENLSGASLSPLEKTAHLYLAKQPK